MGQYLSLPCFLLGVFGLWRAYKERAPAGWVEPGDERAQPDAEPDDEDEDEDEDEEEPGDGDGDADQPKGGDADVDAEFEDGKLKKQRGPG
jgi:hypothetical protein